MYISFIRFILSKSLCNWIVVAGLSQGLPPEDRLYKFVRKSPAPQIWYPWRLTIQIAWAAGFSSP